MRRLATGPVRDGRKCLSPLMQQHKIGNANITYETPSSDVEGLFDNDGSQRRDRAIASASATNASCPGNCALFAGLRQSRCGNCLGIVPRVNQDGNAGGTAAASIAARRDESGSGMPRKRCRDRRGPCAHDVIVMTMTSLQSKLMGECDGDYDCAKLAR